MPDSWAIKQLFPIMPIHRLTEQPTRRAVLGDISVDSDGKIDQFIDLRDVRSTLELHSFTGQPYYSGLLAWRVSGNLGDLHNLFGDPTRSTCAMDESGEIVLDGVVKGDTVRESWPTCSTTVIELLNQLRKDVERAVRINMITVQEIAAIAAVLRDWIGRVHLPGRALTDAMAPIYVALTICQRHGANS